MRSAYHFAQIQLPSDEEITFAWHADFWRSGLKLVYLLVSIYSLHLSWSFNSHSEPIPPLCRRWDWILYQLEGKQHTTIRRTSLSEYKFYGTRIGQLNVRSRR